MQKWPPRYPQDEKAVGSLTALIQNVQDLLSQEDLAPDERKIIASMRPGNTTVGLSIEKGDQLAVLLETFRKIRFRTHKVLLSAPVEHFFSAPVRIAHAGVNGLSKANAAALANVLAADFVDFSEEQYAFAQEAGASRRELNKIAPGRYDASLRTLHELIRERALPLTPVG